MAKIISVMNQKGGVGKTTVAVNLCGALHTLNAPTMLVDTDPQASAREWSAASDKKSFPVIGIDRGGLEKQLSQFHSDYAYIVMDTPSRLDRQLGEIVALSDIVIVPIGPSAFDYWATCELLCILSQRQKLAPLQAFVVINGADNRSTLHIELQTALHDSPVPVLGGRIGQRTAYRHSAAKGLTVFDSNNDAAKTEMKKIVLETIPEAYNHA